MCPQPSGPLRRGTLANTSYISLAIDPVPSAKNPKGSAVRKVRGTPFASLRWGEVTALRRCDLDLDSGSVWVRAAFIERSTGEMLLGPPKSRAGRRVVGLPDAIIPALREHLAAYTGGEPGSLVFPGVKGGPLRRGTSTRCPAGRKWCG